MTTRRYLLQRHVYETRMSAAICPEQTRLFFLSRACKIYQLTCYMVMAKEKWENYLWSVLALGFFSPQCLSSTWALHTAAWEEPLHSAWHGMAWRRMVGDVKKPDLFLGVFSFSALAQSEMGIWGSYGIFGRHLT
jgi:hypothetical protein